MTSPNWLVTSDGQDHHISGTAVLLPGNTPRIDHNAGWALRGLQQIEQRQPHITGRSAGNAVVAGCVLVTVFRTLRRARYFPEGVRGKVVRRPRDR